MPKYRTATWRDRNLMFASYPSASIDDALRDVIVNKLAAALSCIDSVDDREPHAVSCVTYKRVSRSIVDECS
jgi:hypothetical protein